MKKLTKTRGESEKMKLILEFKNWEINHLWVCASGSFLTEQAERFEVLPEGEGRQPLEVCKGDSKETCSLLWSDSFLEAKILGDLYRAKDYSVVLLWDMQEHVFCNWIKCSIDKISPPRA